MRHRIVSSSTSKSVQPQTMHRNRRLRLMKTRRGATPTGSACLPRRSLHSHCRRRTAMFYKLASASGCVQSGENLRDRRTQRASPMTTPFADINHTRHRQTMIRIRPVSRLRSLVNNAMNCVLLLIALVNAQGEPELMDCDDSADPTEEMDWAPVVNQRITTPLPRRSLHSHCHRRTLIHRRLVSQLRSLVNNWASIQQPSADPTEEMDWDPVVEQTNNDSTDDGYHSDPESDDTNRTGRLPFSVVH
ncbi:hypothetical protein QR680_010522 [Steinernema hermaphroditum]|uniref:Uncharacterized protein n=1 Tax=Steinernema hermaphroditum TaxID=289476 RepID=A0AA39IPB3_9BILA|nr:hypothetical protein QR680_010522 [Steinernema hermaphroditum]